MNFQNNKRLIMGIACLFVILISLSYAQLPITACEPIKHTNVECADFYLSRPTTASTFDFKQAQAIFPQINQDLITKNIQKYSDELLLNNYQMTASSDALKIIYTYDGLITHPVTKKEINAKAFPSNTKFNLTAEGIEITIPDNAKIDPSKFGEGTVNLNPGKAILPDGKVLEQSGAIVQDGKIYLMKGGSAKLNGVSIKNTGEELLHISPSTLSNIDNSVSFVNDKLITKASALKGAYDLFFDESGKSVSLGRSANNIFSSVDNYKDLGNVKQIQESLNSLGYTDYNSKPLSIDGDTGPKTKSAVKKFQIDYNKNHPDSQIGVDGVIGPETRQALNEQMGEYAKMTSNGNNLDFYRDSNGNYQSAIKNEAGEIYSVQSQGSKPSVIQTQSGDSVSVGSNNAGVIANSKEVPIVKSDPGIYSLTASSSDNALRNKVISQLDTYVKEGTSGNTLFAESCPVGDIKNGLSCFSTATSAYNAAGAEKNGVWTSLKKVSIKNPSRENSFDLKPADLIQIEERHNVIFSSWKDEANHVAYVYSHPGAKYPNSPFKYEELDLNKNPVTIIWEPKVTDSSDNLVLASNK
jgi:peptidoglycan hydrolase-like protein with peptidoglycan-binding domain